MTTSLSAPLTVPAGTPVGTAGPPRSLVADGVRLLALVWIIPFVMLAVGLPLVGIVALLAWAFSLA